MSDPFSWNKHIQDMNKSDKLRPVPDVRAETVPPTRATHHELKTLVKPFTATWEGNKYYEYRQNDRNFQVGDTLLLREFRLDEPLTDDEGQLIYYPDNGKYTGREIRTKITYMTIINDFVCILGICPERMSRSGY